MADKIGEEKLLYLIQIQYLEEQLERSQLKCDELEKQYEDLASQYDVLENDKKDITRYLKRSVAAKERKVEELEEELEGQEQAALQYMEALSLQHMQELQELQQQMDELKSERRMQATQIEKQKEKLLQQLADMKSVEKQLVSLNEEHEAAIHSLRIEREKMIEDTQNTKEDSAQMKISDALQRQRAQHNKMEERLQSHLADSVSLQREKDVMQDRVSDVCARRDYLRADFNKATQESSVQKKKLEQLRKEVRQQTVLLKNQNITHQQKLVQTEALRQRLATVSKDYRQKAAEANQLGTELQKEMSRSRQLERVMQEAAIILRHILTDSDKASETRRKMRRLLEILDSTAPPKGTASALNDTAVKSNRGQRPWTSAPIQTSQKTSGSAQRQEPPPLQTAEPHPDTCKTDQCFSK